MADNQPTFLLVFLLDGRRYALPLPHVEQSVAAVAPSFLPCALDFVAGVVNFHGRILPLIDLRGRFGLPSREIGAYDLFLIARSSRRSMALWVDSVEGVMPLPEDDISPADQVIPGIRYLQGMTRLPGDIYFIFDIEKCLSLEEEDLLREALPEISRT